MKIISWDIGINNLAYCIMNNKNIIKWDKIDILDDIRSPEHNCQGFLKNNNPCTKKASYFNENNNIRAYYCGTHCKNQKNIKKILKHELCNDSLKNGNPCKNKAIYYYCTINNDNQEYNRYLCQKHSTDYGDDDLKKYITIENISFFERSQLLFDKLDKLCDCDQKDDNILDVEHVVIENQPVHKNPIMKSIQMMLYSFYMLRGKDKIKEIHLVNATQKMKIYDGPKIECKIKDTHEKNKFLGKEYCKYFLKDNQEMLDYYNSYDKKDDLADTYLQGLYFYKNH